MRTRKAAIAAVLALVLVLGGCAALIQFVGEAQQILCDPTAEQQAAADQVINFIVSGAVFAVPLVVKLATGVSLEVTPEMALGALSAVRSGACVGATDLEAALLWLQEITAPTKALMPDTGPLWAMIK
jgi:hypothetical protein